MREGQGMMGVGHGRAMKRRAQRRQKYPALREILRSSRISSGMLLPPPYQGRVYRLLLLYLLHPFVVS